jgi:hypothetical protein
MKRENEAPFYFSISNHSANYLLKSISTLPAVTSINTGLANNSYVELNILLA